MRHQFATVHELARIELLAGLPGEVLGELAARMERRALEPGDVILEARDEQGRFYVLLSGMVSARSGRVLRPGDTLTDLTLFGEPVQAVTPAVVASCDRATFDELVRPVLGDG